MITQLAKIKYLSLCGMTHLHRKSTFSFLVVAILNLHQTGFGLVK